MSINSLSLVSAHGTQDIPLEVGDRIVDALTKHQIPWSAVTLYSRQGEDESYKIFTGLELRPNDLAADIELFAFYQRNVDPFAFRISDIGVMQVSAGEEPAAEFFYRDPRKPYASENVLKKLTSEECKAIVRGCVHKAIRENIQPYQKIVVGVSGGGDSNAMLDALTTFDDFALSIYPVILKGLPEWDSGVTRAQELCDTYKLPLKVIHEQELRAINGWKEDDLGLVEHFLKFFPKEDFEFLGVHLIGTALLFEANRVGAQYVCKGANLEDLLGDALYALCNNTKQRSLPVYNYQGLNMFTPLWLVPKKIIDGCFPRYSLQNYQERHPCSAPGRTLFYQMAYTLLSQYPHVAERMLIGLAQVGDEAAAETIFDESFGFEIASNTSLPIREQIRRLFDKLQ